MQKRRGPSTDPWGTPDKDGTMADCFPPITNCFKRCALQIIPCTTCSHHIVQLICVYVVILSGCLNTVLICIRNRSLFELRMNILNDIVLVLFCSCHVFIVSLISFASYIIAKYMHDVCLSHLNKDYSLT